WSLARGGARGWISSSPRPRRCRAPRSRRKSSHPPRAAPDSPPSVLGKSFVRVIGRYDIVTRGLDHASRIYPTCAPKTARNRVNPILGGPSFFARTFCEEDGLPGQARQ